MNVETPKMFRWQYFITMGNNCRLKGMSQSQAQEIIDLEAEQTDDGDNFWHGFLDGREEEIQQLPLRSDLL
jgi:hypothetical protein